MTRTRKTLFNRTPAEWEALLRTIPWWGVYSAVLRIVWFDYISQGVCPTFGEDLLSFPSGDWEPPPETIYAELLRLGYPRLRARKRAWCWSGGRRVQKSKRPSDASGVRGLGEKRASSSSLPNG